jgi:hypothetical protein
MTLLVTVYWKNGTSADSPFVKSVGLGFSFAARTESCKVHWGHFGALGAICAV